MNNKSIISENEISSDTGAAPRTMRTTLTTGPQLPTTTRTTRTLSYRSSHLDSREHVTLEEVSKAYFLCRKKKRMKDTALQYELDYELQNYKLYQELNNCTYEISPSIAFCTEKPLLREIFTANFRDRIVDWIIVLKLLPTIEELLIPTSFSCRKGKGTLYGIMQVKEQMSKVNNEYWIWRGDIQGFFMSINLDIMWKLLEPIIEKAVKTDVDWWKWLIHKVVFNRPEKNCTKQGNLKLWDKLSNNKSLFKSNGKGMPIGKLLSQIFANVYLDSFDKWILSQLLENEYYDRSADDFIVIMKDKQRLLKLRTLAKEWIKENLDLTMHHRKSEIQQVKRGTKFLGSFIKNNIIYPSRRTIYEAKKSIKEYNQGLIDIDKFIRKINSYYGLLRHYRSYNVRKKLFKLIDNHNNLVNIFNIKVEKI